MFNSGDAVMTYGILVLVDGIALLYAAVGRGVNYAKITGYALLAGFLLRLYSLIGVFLISQSWRPPSYLSHAASVLILAVYWIWVKVSERPIQ